MSIVILVPFGAELRAVQRGLKATSTRQIPVTSSITSPITSPITVIGIPAGKAVRSFLQREIQHKTQHEIRHETQHKTQQDVVQDWATVTEVIVMGLCGGLSDSVTIGQVGYYLSCQFHPKLLKASPLETQHMPENDRKLHHQEWNHDRDNQPQINLELLSLLQKTQPIAQWRGLTIDQVVTTEQEKRSLHSQTHCDVVDMESAWISSLMRDRGIGVTVVRVVSDAVTGDLPDLSQAFDSRGHLRPFPLALALLRRPIAALRLIRGSIVALRQLEACAMTLGECYVE